MSSLLSKISEKSAAKSGELPTLISLSLLFFFLVVAMSIKVRLLDFPLERDEGAFSYMAKLVLSGERLYVDGFDFKPPGLYLAYALFMKIFGETAGGIRAGLLVFTGLSVCMFFQISRKMLSPTASLAGTLAFSVFAVSPAFLSHAAHATQVVILPLLLGLWSIFSFFKKPSRALPLIGGVAMGVAFFVKQPALIFGFFGGAFFLFSGYFSGESTKWITVLNAVFYIAGFLIPVFFILAWLSYTTSLSEYWFWNFTYPRDYGTVLGLKEGLSNFRIMFPNVVGNFKGMWLICISGLLFLPFYNKGCKYGVLIGGLVIISFVAVIPGLYFRKHYFVVMFPALAFLSGIWVDFLMKWCGKKTNRVFAFIPPLIFLMCAVSSMYVEREYFFTGDPARLSEEIYGENPFAASIEVGEYIKANSKEGDQIFVFGSEPQIYFYSGRRSVSPLIFTYPLVENNAFAKELQGELINALEKNIPRYFVYVNVPFSWSAHPEYDRKIFSWVSQFLEKHFTLEGYVDLIGDGKTEFSWGEKNIVSPPKSENSILVFKKKEPEIGEVLSLDPLGTRKRTKY